MRTTCSGPFGKAMHPSVVKHATQSTIALAVVLVASITVYWALVAARTWNPPREAGDVAVLGLFSAGALVWALAVLRWYLSRGRLSRNCGRS